MDRKRRFADWLNDQLRRSNMTVAGLARRVGLSHQAVSDWANGRTLPNAESVGKLARIFGLMEQEVASLAGRITGEVRPETLSFEEHLELARLKSPWALPIEGIASAGPGGPADVIWRDPAERGRNLRAVEITGDCLEPEISPGDAVTVDLDGRWEPGCIVVAHYRGGVVAKYYDSDCLRGLDGTEIPITEAEIIGVVEDVRKRPRRRSRAELLNRSSG